MRGTIGAQLKVVGCREYLQNLLAYLESFHERTQPLAQMQKQLKKVMSQMDVTLKTLMS